MIRPAVAADVPGITRLVRDAYAKYVPRMGREPMPMTVDYADVVQWTWVAEDDGTLSGVLVIRAEAGHLLVENLAVRTDQQGTGVGTQLLEFADRRATAERLHELRLYTHETMTENIEFYARHGWTETHRGGDSGFRRVFFTRFR